MPLHKTSKEQIIKKSLFVFREKGYYHSTISDLSKACNIEKPHFYYYFSSKQELMKSTLKYAHDFIHRLILKKAYNNDESALERIKIMMKLLIKLYSREFSGCLFGNTVLETIKNEIEFAPLLREYFNEWFKAFFHLFKEKYSENEAEYMAKEFVIIIQGSIMMMQLYDDDSYLRRAAERAITLISDNN